MSSQPPAQLMPEATKPRQIHDEGTMSWPRTLWTYLSPGVPPIVVYLIGGRWLVDRHQPADLALAAGFLLVSSPIELGRTLRAVRRRTGSWSLRAGVDFTEPSTPGRFIARALLLLVLAFALLFATLPLTDWLVHGPLAFLPSFFKPHYDWTTLQRPKAWLLTVGAILIAVNGLLMPWVEEVYYRGYLLARTPGGRGASVVIAGVLFAVEHLWQPQNWPLIAGLAIMLSVAAYRWRNIWIGYAVHAVANTFGIVVIVIAMVNR